MAHRPDSGTAALGGPGPLYDVPSDLGAVPPRSFSKTGRERGVHVRSTAPVRGNLHVELGVETLHVALPLV